MADTASDRMEKFKTAALVLSGRGGCRGLFDRYAGEWQALTVNEKLDALSQLARRGFPPDQVLALTQAVHATYPDQTSLLRGMLKGCGVLLNALFDACIKEIGLWRCPDCGHEERRSYDVLAGCGAPYCRDCGSEMEPVNG